MSKKSPISSAQRQQSPRNNPIDFNFMTLPPDANGTIYRVPVINFNKKPFNGRQYNQSLGTKEEVWNEDDTRYRPAKRPKHSFDKMD